MNLTQTEPAVLIGLIATIIVGAAEQIVGSGVVTSQGTLNLLALVISVTPVIASIIIRFFVSSPATVAKLQAAAPPPAP